MDKETFSQKIKNLIGAMAWRVFIWSISMTEDEYFDAICKQQAPKNGILKTEVIYDDIK
jgi:hypothetical protein